MIDLDELERKHKAVESGEWRTCGPSRPRPDSPEGGDFAIICGSDIIAETFYRSDYETTHNAKANAEFIAALRNAAPELIAMARRYQWLREHTVATGLSQWVHPHQFLDAAIDVAMQEQKR